VEITKDAKQDLSVALATCLADATVMYHRTHGFHWNVVGTDFPQYHAKFEEIYEDVFDSLDPMAENLRKLGVFAPFRLMDLARMASVQDDAVSGYHHDTLVASLAFTNMGVLASLEKAFALATQANQQGIANFLADRIDQHNKWAWQLNASLQG
jgi:starvation-inducible DNA-binding protein